MNKKYNIGKIFVYIILIGGVGITVFPFIWMILTSFKSQIESIKIPITIFPKEWLIKNYFAVFKAIPFGRM